MIGIQRTSEGGLRVDVRFSRPLLYLDSGAIGSLAATDEQAGVALREALLGKDGTLLFSWIHVLELVQIAPGPRYRRVREYLEGFGQNFTLIEGDPYRLLKLGVQPDLAPNDAKRLVDHQFLNTCLTPEDPERPPTLGTVLDQSEEERHADPDSLSKVLQSFKVNQANTLSAALATLEAHGIRLRPQRPTAYGPAESRHPRHTLDTIMLEMAREHEKYTPSDAADVCHAAVGATYADFCLLDNKWAARIRERVPVENRAATFEWRSRRELIAGIASYV